MLGCIFGKLIEIVRVLENVELVNPIKLGVKAHLCNIMLLSFALPALFLFFHELQELFVFEGALPAFNLTVVKGDQEAANRVERGQVDRSHCVVGTVIKAGELGDLDHAGSVTSQVDVSVGGSNTEVASARCVEAARDSLTFLEVNFEHTGNLELVDGDELEHTVQVTNESLRFVRASCDEADGSQSVLWELHDLVNHHRSVDFDISAVAATTGHENSLLGARVVLDHIDL